MLSFFFVDLILFRLTTNYEKYFGKLKENVNKIYKPPPERSTLIFCLS